MPTVCSRQRILVRFGVGTLLASGLLLNAAGAADAWRVEPGARWRPAVPASGTVEGFRAVTGTAQRGVAFTNRVHSVAARNNQILENGAGVALGDVDGDGLCDVYLCGSEPANALFRNLGQWRFADVTAASGVACTGQFSTGATFADVDGDHDLDLLVNGLGVGTRLFRNDGTGRFSEDTQAGLVRRQGATSLALADFDGDGDLDLYVATYRVTSARSEVPPPNVEVRRVQERLVVTPANRFLAFALTDGNVELAEKGEPDLFYLNNGQGRFEQVSWTQGTFLDESGRPLAAPPEDWGLSVLFRDLTGDGYPDLYVCNDFFRSRDQFWIHDGRARFRAASTLAWRNMSLSSMAADAADIDRDGHDDLLVAEMLALDHGLRHRQRANAFRPEQALPMSDPAYRPELPRNTLFHARGDGSFAEIAQFAGLAASDWSWNAVFLDIDLDGFEDVLCATGNAHDVLDLDSQNALDRASRRGPVEVLDFYPPLHQRPLAFRNLGNRTFTNTSVAWGLTEAGIAQGMALGDLDNDGDLDVVMNRLQAAALVLRNDSPAPRVSVRLRGLPPNTRGVGAKIRVLGGAVPQSQEIMAGGRYLSSDDMVRTFAAPTNASRLDLEVSWRSGRRTWVPGIAPNRLYEVEESAASPPSATNRLFPRAAPLFADVSAQLGHRHLRPDAPDFVRQPLLPRSLNHLGPGVAWLDWDEDGWEDLVVPGGVGRPLSFLRNVEGTHFVAQPSGSDASGATGDHLAVVPWVGDATFRAVLVSAGSHSAVASNPVVALSLRAPVGALVTALPFPGASPGPIAVADVDADGDLDVFVGGRHVPGRYPEPATSQFYRNDEGVLVPDSVRAAPFRQVGMVSGAVFTDLEGDGSPDLILACDWGPVRAFRNREGRFTEITRDLGLEVWTGCWAGIGVGDFDEDGRPDLVVANLGRNTRHQIPGPSVWRLDAADLDADGTFEVVESYRRADTGDFVPWRTLDVLGRAVPRWLDAVGTFRALGEATTGSLLQGVTSDRVTVEVRTFEHRVFLNRGDRFESVALSDRAQFAPGFGIAVADWDGDGHLDVFLAQNTFDLDLDSGRADAGMGLCLLGDGRGGFRPLSPAESGIRLPGAQRGVAVADFDHDGRPDLCVTQVNQETGLFRNTTGTAGTRIRVQGPPGNPRGIGVGLRRMRHGVGLGPLREIRGGSGSLSSDSTTLIVPRLGEVCEWQVRWPGGLTTRHGVPANAREAGFSLEQSGSRDDRD